LAVSLFDLIRLKLILGRVLVIGQTKPMDQGIRNTHLAIRNLAITIKGIKATDKLAIRKMYLEIGILAMKIRHAINTMSKLDMGETQLTIYAMNNSVSK
jgi:hypothetical protein